jgi:non-canonical (house-cleaning) NTP pyrophosphatase
MLILVGSTRAAKVEGVRLAIEAVGARDPRFRDAIVEPVDVTGVAPAMPMTEAAIIQGARDRAAAVLRRRGGANPDLLAIGVEGGIDPLPQGVGCDVGRGGDRYALKTWAAVTDGTRWSCGAGGAVLLPDAVARQVIAGRELGDVIDALAGAPVRGTRGAWGLLTLDLVGRRDAFKLAVVACLAPFYNPALYGT